MKSFAKYVETLEKLTSDAISEAQSPIISSKIKAALDGQPNKEFRRLVPLEMRRKNGAFFSGAALAKRALRLLVKNNKEEKVFLDPACGIGDLLLSCASVLPLGKDVKETLKIWSNHVLGMDIHHEFLRATKARLTLLALVRHKYLKPGFLPPPEELFKQVRHANAYNDTNMIERASHIIINPPFGYVQAPESCNWAQGNVSAAALFLEQIILNSSNGTTVVAILPDVLRSGERYNEWRKNIQSKALVEAVKIFGQFDKLTDIDVFLLKLQVKRNTNNSIAWWKAQRSVKGKTVRDFFEVHVGSVVPYRDPKKGVNHIYIFPQVVTPWKIIESFNTKRKYSGNTFLPPFVVVRRTSRPGEKYRAIGAIVKGQKAIAVENHLVVLIPKDGTLKRCKELLTVLRHKKTTEWLNERIRCRHLTVQSLKELPININT